METILKKFVVRDFLESTFVYKDDDQDALAIIPLIQSRHCERRYISHQQLFQVIQSTLISCNGRISLIDLTALVSVDARYIKKFWRYQLLTTITSTPENADSVWLTSSDNERESKLTLVGDEIMNQEYISRLVNNFSDLIHSIKYSIYNPVSHATIAHHLRLPLEFVDDQIIQPFIINRQSLQSIVIYRNNHFYSHRYFSILESQLLGILMGAVVPIALSSVRDMLHHFKQIEDGDIIHAVQSIISKKSFLGEYAGRMYFPMLYLNNCNDRIADLFQKEGIVQHSHIKSLVTYKDPFTLMSQLSSSRNLGIIHEIASSITVADSLLHRVTIAFQSLRPKSIISSSDDDLSASSCWCFVIASTLPTAITIDEGNELLSYVWNHKLTSSSQRLVTIICPGVAVHNSFLKWIKSGVKSDIQRHAESLAKQIFPSYLHALQGDQKTIQQKTMTDIAAFVSESVIEKHAQSMDRMHTWTRKLSPELFDDILVHGTKMDLASIRLGMWQSMDVSAYLRETYREYIPEALLALFQSELIAAATSIPPIIKSHIETHRDNLFTQLWSELLVIGKAVASLEEKKFPEVLNEEGNYQSKDSQPKEGRALIMEEIHVNILRTSCADIVAFLVEYCCLLYSSHTNNRRNLLAGNMLSNNLRSLRARHSILNTDFMRQMSADLDMPREVSQTLMKLWMSLRLNNLWAFMSYITNTVSKVLSMSIVPRLEKKRDRTTAQCLMSQLVKAFASAHYQESLLQWDREMSPRVAGRFILCLLFNHLNAHNGCFLKWSDSSSSQVDLYVVSHLQQRKLSEEISIILDRIIPWLDSTTTTVDSSVSVVEVIEQVMSTLT